jgi:hypothetical protein
MGKTILVFLALLILITARLVPTSVAWAQQPQNDQSSKEGQRQMLGAYIDVPSADTTPVEFSVGNVRYRAPRNYIVNMNNYKGGPQPLVAFELTVPGFEPFSEKTKDCMTKPLAYLPPNCFPVKFNIIGSTPVSDDEGFQNMSDLFHSQSPKQGPYGFELYETGPENARIETYRKQANGHTLVIDCFIQDPQMQREAICNNRSRLQNQNGLNYSFNKNRLQYAEQIDGELRRLLDSFTVKEMNEEIHG